MSRLIPVTRTRMSFCIQNRDVETNVSAIREITVLMRQVPIRYCTYLPRYHPFPGQEASSGPPFR